MESFLDLLDNPSFLQLEYVAFSAFLIFLLNSIYHRRNYEKQTKDLRKYERQKWFDEISYNEYMNLRCKLDELANISWFKIDSLMSKSKLSSSNLPEYLSDIFGMYYLAKTDILGRTLQLASEVRAINDFIGISDENKFIEEIISKCFTLFGITDNFISTCRDKFNNGEIVVNFYCDEASSKFDEIKDDILSLTYYLRGRLGIPYPYSSKVDGLFNGGKPTDEKPVPVDKTNE